MLSSTACCAMQSLAERIHDKFLEVEKYMKVAPQPEMDVESHGRETTSGKDTCTSSQKSSGVNATDGHVHQADASVRSANIAAGDHHDVVDLDQKGVIFADTEL